MAVKGAGVLPPFDTFCSTDMHIRIYPKANTFGAEVRVSGRRTEIFDIKLTSQDVEELNKGLQQAIQTVAGNCEDSGVSDEVLLQLAVAGQAAFNRIFADSKPRRTILEALEILCGNAYPTIEISSESFFVPWELLYNGPLGPSVDISRFWGMRYILARIIIQDGCLGGMVSPIIQSSRPSVGLVTCDELDHVVRQERPVLQKLHKSRRIKLLLLRPLETNQQYKELEYFGRFLCRKLHIAHFACHAYMKEPLDLSFLRISNSFNITMRDVYSREFAIKHNPLVILNACHTGVVHPLSTSSWAALFWKYGARGVLATEFRVPDDFAAAFTEELYQHFLLGKPIGLVLLTIRRSFWEGRRNPLGLAYALYSPLAVRIVN